MKAASKHSLVPVRLSVAMCGVARYVSLGTRLLCILLLALLSTWAWSQSQPAAVSGTITDRSGAVILRARVVIVSQVAGLERSTLTDTPGSYHFSGLPPGTYTIHVEDQGFQTQVRTGVALVSASESVIDFSLTVGDIRQQITVYANPSDIDTTTSTVSGVMAEPSLAKLPLDNQDLFSAVALEPGVAPNPSSAPSLLSNGRSGQVAINGIRPSMTNVLVDGLDATDPVFGYSPAGASGLFLGLNELAEVNVLTQTFNAEFGGHGGAVIDLTTKSGGNQFHGSLSELHRDASIDAKIYFDLTANPIPPFVRNQFGTSLGGPLKRDRMFFFTNYEGFREVQAATAIATYPMPSHIRDCCHRLVIRPAAATPLPTDASPFR